MGTPVAARTLDRNPTACPVPNCLTGKLKERRYDASRGMSLLVEDWVSAASGGCPFCSLKGLKRQQPLNRPARTGLGLSLGNKGCSDGTRCTQLLRLLTLSHLAVQPYPPAAAKQRRGRAGRVRPGVCYGLYTRDRFEHRMRRYQVGW